MKLGRNLWVLGAAFAAVFVATALLADDAFVIPIILVMLLAGAAALVNTLLARRGRGTRPAHLDPAPADDPTPLGDTPEAHDEISVHDLPIGHPGRSEAARQAAGSGVTRGDV